MRCSPDLTGKKFGRLTAVEFLGSLSLSSVWLCLCECGGTKNVGSYLLRRGDTRSCGCMQRENAASLKMKHGLSTSSTYRSWSAMICRCTKPYTNSYELYGGRGISVCARWAEFENFLADMGERPAGRSIDRIDCDGNYEPSNCRWATASQQQRNKRIKIRSEDGNSSSDSDGK